MKRHQNLFMLLLVFALVAIPLWTIQKPAPGADGKETYLFRGSDDQAKELIEKISPGYHPWFRSLMEPPSGEIASLLFSLQAALGAGFIGYYFGVARKKSKPGSDAGKGARC